MSENNSRETAPAVKGHFAVRLLLVLVASIGFSTLATGSPAEASPTPQSVAVASVSVQQDVSSVMLPAWSIGDCVAVARNVFGSPWQKVLAATRSWRCGAYLGGLNASFICWADDQWWGGFHRWVIRMITGYTDHC